MTLGRTEVRAAYRREYSTTWFNSILKYALAKVSAVQWLIKQQHTSRKRYAIDINLSLFFCGTAGWKSVGFGSFCNRSPSWKLQPNYLSKFYTSALNINWKKSGPDFKTLLSTILTYSFLYSDKNWKPFNQAMFLLPPSPPPRINPPLLVPWLPRLPTLLLFLTYLSLLCDKELNIPFSYSFTNPADSLPTSFYFVTR